jgi:hypothetical protein
MVFKKIKTKIDTMIELRNVKKIAREFKEGKVFEIIDVEKDLC